MATETANIAVLDRFVAIDNVCAWPNVQLLPDGSVGAFIFNRPSHGQVEGDIELWKSHEGRAPWQFCSTVSAHEPGTVRMNMAAGVLRSGRVVVLVSGWNLESEAEIRTERILESIEVCVSDDAGATWQRNGRFEPPERSGGIMPFGNIRDTAEGELLVAAYDCRMSSASRESRTSSSMVFAGSPDGESFTYRGTIGADRYTETDIVASAGGWLAAARTLSDYTHPEDPHSAPWVELFRSDDDGRSWSREVNLSLPNQHPGNLTRLSDGTLLFTCGSRIPGFYGVFARLSRDEGRTWSEPALLAHDGLSRDLGYPSTVQLPSGILLTAYYSKSSSAHTNYHAAVVLWEPSM